VAILRHLGVKAYVAWVERATQPLPLPNVAQDGAFNHAIVWAQGEGREWWIDPTNFASFAQGIFPDIIDRDALIVDPANPRLAHIPEGRPNESTRLGLGRLRLERSGDATIDASLKFTGRAAQFYTGATLRQSKEHIDHYLITSMVEENRLKWHKIDDYDLASRITRDFDVHLKWGESMYSMRTTLGPAFYLTGPEVDTVLHLETKNRVSDLFLGQPDTVKSVDLYEDVRALGKSAPTCALDSPWLSVRRAVEQTSGGLRVTDTRIVKKSLITNAELRSPVFHKFQERLLKCFDRIAVVYAPSKSTSPRAISSEAMK
jgi:hypothetical protein